jgi:hypothetical protein
MHDTVRGWIGCYRKVSARRKLSQARVFPQPGSRVSRRSGAADSPQGAALVKGDDSVRAEVDQVWLSAPQQEERGRGRRPGDPSQILEGRNLDIGRERCQALFRQAHHFFPRLQRGQVASSCPAKSCSTAPGSRIKVKIPLVNIHYFSGRIRSIQAGLEFSFAAGRPDAHPTSPSEPPHARAFLTRFISRTQTPRSRPQPSASPGGSCVGGKKTKRT